MIPPSNLKRRAVALVIVLSVIVILSAIIVAMAIAMRMERQAAYYFVERSSADLLARDGIECVKATIKAATSDPGRQWITMPGRIVSATNSYGAGVSVYDLHSGSASASDTNSPNLDRLVRSDDSRTLITGANTENQPMRLTWVYVRKDGTRDYSGSPDTTNSTNPIIGRFAYWTDDESARIDLNTAWKRFGNTNTSANHPTKVDLLAIPGFTDSMADAVHDTAANTAFNSPDEVRRISTIAGIASTNRFSLSHYAFSSALNPWGLPKILLTTQKANLPEEIQSLSNSSTYYLDVVASDNADPGLYTGLTTAKTIQQLNRIQAFLGTNRVPYSSSTFATKYSSLDRAQIALDILEYVRSAESSSKVVLPLRVRYDTSAGTFTFSGVTDTNSDIIIGSSRRPMFTEIAVDCAPMTTNIQGKLTLNFTVTAEVCIPKSYGLSASDLAGGRIGLQTYRSSAYSNAASTTWGPGIATATIGSDPTIQTYEDSKYIFFVAKQTAIKTSQFTDASASDYGLFTNRPDKLWARATILPPAGLAANGFGQPFWDVAPAAGFSDQNFTNYLAEIVVTNGLSSQVSDPRVNKYKANWVSGLPQTFGAINTNWLQSVAASPPQDKDGGGAVSDASFRVPAPKGTSSNPYGTVQSIAELGYIPSGIAENIPWRTLRLQPTPGSSSLPDWALLDAFAAPYYPNSNSALYTPRTNAVAGRVNLNAGIWPFASASRSIPITALFQDTTNDPAFTSNKMAVAVSNIVNRVYATGGQNLGGTNGFLSVGEMAEIQGVSDGGEASEHRLLGVVDLATVQGNVFRVYSMGQSLAQTPSGKLVPQAEKLIIAIVERMSDGTLRTLYWRVVPI